MREALESAGFDARQVRTLAHQGQQPQRGQARSSYDASTLQSLKSIMEQYDLTQMSRADQSDLYSQLTQAGLLKTGASGVWDRTA